MQRKAFLEVFGINFSIDFLLIYLEYCRNLAFETKVNFLKKLLVSMH